MALGNFEQRVLNICRDKNVIFIFVSKDDEVETRFIIDELLELGKTVVVPVTETRKNTMRISRLVSLEDVAVGAYGICEPTKEIEFPKEDIEIFFVPGTAFDRAGNRKGRGKGYFDRFLADIKGKKSIIGLCYKDQIVDKLIPNSWDIPADTILEK